MTVLVVVEMFNALNALSENNSLLQARPRGPRARAPPRRRPPQNLVYLLLHIFLLLVGLFLVLVSYLSSCFCSPRGCACRARQARVRMRPPSAHALPVGSGGRMPARVGGLRGMRQARLLPLAFARAPGGRPHSSGQRCRLRAALA